MTNEEMRVLSGLVESDNPLVSFLYLLCRDHLPIGTVENLVTQVEEQRVPAVFTNGWSASYAKCLAARLSMRVEK